MAAVLRAMRCYELLQAAVAMVRGQLLEAAVLQVVVHLLPCTAGTSANKEQEVCSSRYSYSRHSSSRQVHPNSSSCYRHIP